VPILIFIVCVLVALDPDVLMANIREGAAVNGSLLEQVRGTMLVTVFVFLGVEGASVYSRYARRREDVAAATIIGFLLVLALLVAVTLLSYGILPRAELAALRNPSMAGVLREVVGPWGSVMVSVGLMISVGGAYLSWILLAAEVLHAAAKADTMPAILGRQNRHGVPAAALWLSNGVVQVLLIGTLFTDDTFVLIKNMASSMSLMPYLFVAGFGLLTAWRDRHTRARWSRRSGYEIVLGGIACVYAAGMICAGGLEYFALSTLVYAPGTLLFLRVRREQAGAVFSGREWPVFALVLAGFVYGVWALGAGAIAL
ncbi:MAG: amino acid permease, partial [Bordetella sp.]|nr:amino acid permease [Bordetella sp.]